MNAVNDTSAVKCYLRVEQHQQIRRFACDKKANSLHLLMCKLSDLFCTPIPLDSILTSVDNGITTELRSDKDWQHALNTQKTIHLHVECVSSDRFLSEEEEYAGDLGDFDILDLDDFDIPAQEYDDTKLAWRTARAKQEAKAAAHAGASRLADATLVARQALGRSSDNVGNSFRSFSVHDTHTTIGRNVVAGFTAMRNRRRGQRSGSNSASVSDTSDSDIGKCYDAGVQTETSSETASAGVAATAELDPNHNIPADNIPDTVQEGRILFSLGMSAGSAPETGPSDSVTDRHSSSNSNSSNNSNIDGISNSDSGSADYWQDLVEGQATQEHEWTHEAETEQQLKEEEQKQEEKAEEEEEEAVNTSGVDEDSSTNSHCLIRNEPVSTLFGSFQFVENTNAIVSQMMEEEDQADLAAAQATAAEAVRRCEEIFNASMQSYLGGLAAGGELVPEQSQQSFERFLQAEWPEDHELLLRTQSGDPACGRTYVEWRRLFDSAIAHKKQQQGD